MAEKARDELNGIKLTAKYSKSKVPKPIRLMKYETKVDQERYLSDSNNNKNLLIKNLPKEFSAHNFYKTFRAFGDIRSCKLVVNYNCESKGYGYVNYYHVESAEKAKKELGEIQGKKILIVNLQKGLTKHSKIKNNIYVKNIPKEKYDDESLKVIYLYN
jgi:RNA recognition motif-containing protein